MNYMKKYFVLLSIIMIIIISKFDNAYAILKFNNIDTSHGLSQSSVEVIFQDSDGYMWFGTNDGLNRYNGYEFKIYNTILGNEKSLVSNYILDINEDKYKNIWVATANGLSKVHKNRDDITNYVYGEHDGNLSNNNVASILITKDNYILIGTQNGLNIYDETLDKFKRVLNDDRLPNQYINSLAQDNNGDIWIGTEGGVVKLDTKKNTTKLFTTKSKDSIVSNLVYKVYFDKEGYIWVGTYDSGISKINIKTNDITNYSNKKGNKKSLPSGVVRNFLRDNQNRLWISTSNGLVYFDEKNNEFINYVNLAYSEDSLIHNNTFSLIEDAEGVIWVGTYAGISRFSVLEHIDYYKTELFNEKSLSSNMISGIFGYDNILWVGTENGLNIIDTKTKENIRIKDNMIKLSSKVIYDVYGNDKYIGIASDRGVDIIDRSNYSTILSYNKDNGLINKKVKSILMTKENKLWVGTTAELFIIDIEKNKITNLTYILDEYSPEDKYVGEIYEDSDKNIWIGLFSHGGLLKLDLKNKEIKKYKNSKNDKNSISNNAIRVITEDLKGNILVGTNLGLNIKEKGKEHFETITIENGLPNNTIYGILIDNNNNPWVSTNKGISKVDMQNKNIINFGVDDGLQGMEFNGKSFFKKDDGNFVFGGINGLNEFDPEKIHVDNINLEISFEEVLVNGIKIDNLQDKELNSSQKNIIIKLFMPNYRNNGDIEYFYKFENLDKKFVENKDVWRMVNNNIIEMNNLLSGNYEMQVVAKNNNGIIINKEKIHFRIKPYFLFSNYAILIYFLVILLIIYRNKMHKNELKKVVENTQLILNKEYEKNYKLLTDKIEIEKSKNNYVVSMSHELRTPLNLISSSEQLIRDLNNKDVIEKEKLNSYLNIIKKNISDLLNNISDLIDKSKMESGHFNLVLSECNIIEVIENTALNLTNLASEKKIEIIVDPEIEEKYMLIDIRSIERCIINLIANAIKFTNEDGVIKVLVFDLDENIKIIVEDNGIGIKKEEQKKIFDKFGQANNKESNKIGSSGLGLNITKNIIELHDGSIKVESEENKGSKFIIILPVKNKII